MTETLSFAPRCNQRMVCPIISPDVLTSGVINLSDQTGAIKLWPGERLQRQAQIGNALLCTWGSKLLLILPEDTTPSPL